MNILFVCNQGQNRSVTAARLLENTHNTRAKGIFNNLIQEKDLEWANLVAVFEDRHRTWIGEHFPREYMMKKIIVVDIPDIYNVMQDELVKILKRKLKRFETK